MAPLEWTSNAYEEIEDLPPPALGLALCVRHRGAHRVVDGGCAAFADRRQPERLRRRLAAADRPPLPLEPPPPPEPIDVRFDEDKLASAIARAMYRLKEEARALRVSKTQTGPVQGRAPSTSGAAVDIEGVTTTWSDTDDGS